MDLPRGLPPRLYVDDEAFAAERERIFGGSWLPVCRTEDVARPGDYVAREVGGEPVVVARARDGGLTALASVCRHRNMVLLSGTGNAAAIRCPYHLWTYSWDGSLVAAPQTAGLDGFDRSEVCLPRLAVETWQGFVLVNTDLDAEPLAPQLVGLDARLAGLRIDEMVRVGAIEWDQPWNWKTTFENYAESYHHQGVHPDTLQPIFPGERSLPATGGDAPWLALDHESTVEGVEPILVLAVFPLLWPTVVRPDSMVWLRIEPHGPARSTLTTEVFVLPELADDEEVVAGHLEATRAVNAQDEVPNRGVAAGLASRYATTPVLHPLEAGIDHFTRWYLQRMGADA